MISLPNSYAPHVPNGFVAKNDLTVTFAKYHGHCYRVQMDPTDPLCTRSFVVWEPAFGELRHPLTLEQTCGLHLVSAIVQTAYLTFNGEVMESPQGKLRSSLIALEGEAATQSVYWMKSPDLSQFWQFLPRDLIGKIFSYFDKHDVLQLRGVCQTWRGADERLWKIWFTTHRVFFPQHAAGECRSFPEFRQRKENYLKKMTPYEGALPKNEYNKRMRDDNWSTEKHIIDVKQEGHSKKIKVTERLSGKVILTDSLPNEVVGLVYIGYHHCPGWFSIDDLLVGHDLKTGTLKVFDPKRRRIMLRQFNADREPIGQVQRESDQIIVTFSERKILQRWNLRGGLESTLDLSYIKGQLMKWDRELMLFRHHHQDAESSLVDLAQPKAQVTTILDANTFERYGNGYLILGNKHLRRYVKTPTGLDLLWSKENVRYDSMYLVGETIICNTGHCGVVTIDPETGEIIQTLYKWEYDSYEIFINENKLFIVTTAYQREVKFHVIDISTAEQLFHCQFSSGTNFAGVDGDTLFFYCNGINRRLYKLDP
jgi:hypothetical protein